MTGGKGTVPVQVSSHSVIGKTGSSSPTQGITGYTGLVNYDPPRKSILARLASVFNSGGVCPSACDGCGNIQSVSGQHVRVPRDVGLKIRQNYKATTPEIDPKHVILTSINTHQHGGDFCVFLPPLIAVGEAINRQILIAEAEEKEKESLTAMTNATMNHNARLADLEKLQETVRTDVDHALAALVEGLVSDAKNSPAILEQMLSISKGDATISKDEP